MRQRAEEPWSGASVGKRGGESIKGSLGTPPPRGSGPLPQRRLPRCSAPPSTEHPRRCALHPVSNGLCASGCSESNLPRPHQTPRPQKTTFFQGVCPNSLSNHFCSQWQEAQNIFPKESKVKHTEVELQLLCPRGHNSGGELQVHGPYYDLELCQDQDCELLFHLGYDPKGQTEDTGQNCLCHVEARPCCAAMVWPSCLVLQTFWCRPSLFHHLSKVQAGEARLPRRPDILNIWICCEKERGSFALFLRVCTHIN